MKVASVVAGYVVIRLSNNLTVFSGTKYGTAYIKITKSRFTPGFGIDRNKHFNGTYCKQDELMYHNLHAMQCQT